ncbi:MAG TPA: transglutaminase-like domain-containing protein [Planctomycetaceae bacterium]|nr:transglutaminase-like domain-containing protein [Planctomycetaceae bacterium]
MARTVLRLVFVAGGLCAVAAALNVYINRFSLHVFIFADYEQFDTPPSPDGVVRIGGERLDFRMPLLSFTPASRERIGRELNLSPRAADFDIAHAITEYVRSKLNARDPRLPRVNEQTGEEILDCGGDCASECSDHARLFVELAQLAGLQARVLWMEGHVTAEYLDRQTGGWVYVDPHVGVYLADDDRRPLSAARAIRRMERGEFVEIAELSDAGRQAVTWHELQGRNPLFYRNILLNGELTVYPGSVLVESGRWAHLLRFWKRPQVLKLTSEYDTSSASYVQTFSARSTALTAIFLGLAWAVLTLPRRKTAASRAPSVPQTPAATTCLNV